MENQFITYQKAREIIASNLMQIENISVPIQQASGSVLAENFIADRDFPPFDRVTMDGIAVNFKAYAEGVRIFPISSINPAGIPQQKLNDPITCIEIMTGAMLPINTDTIIPYEHFSIIDNNAVLQKFNVIEKQNIHFKGSDIKKGTIMIPAGKVLSSAEINVAASIGKSNIVVKKLPTAAIISTGDELVDVHEQPSDHQIRRSNVYGIQNTLKSWGISSVLNHIIDDKEALKTKIKKLLNEYDFLIITGGVSKGKFDFLPNVFLSIGVSKHFYKIQQRPGKPFWFGTSKNNKRVFALPGNPVSSFVCLYVYVKYWIIKSLNQQEEKVYVELNKTVTFAPNLIYFLEAKIESSITGKLIAHPIKGNGSGDFANLTNADGFLVLPQNQSEFQKGKCFPFIFYRNISL